MNKKKLTIISVALVMIMAVGGILAYLTDTASVTNTFTVGNVDIELDEAVVDTDGNPLREGQIVDDVTQAERTQNTTEEGKVEGNEYHLIPGQSYVKDPTVTVAAGSEESYVRMIVKVNCVEALNDIFDAHNGDEDFALNAIFGDYNEKWVLTGEPKNVTEVLDDGTSSVDKRVYEFRYVTKVSGLDANGVALTDDLVLEPLFKTLNVPGAMTTEEMRSIATLKIEIEGHAIQAVGFEDTKDAEGNVTSTAEDNAWAAFDNQMK